MLERRLNWQTATWLLWRLERHGEDIQCLIGLQPRGLQGQYVFNGRRLYEYMFDGWAQVSSWAHQTRLDLESKGWTAATPLQRANAEPGRRGGTLETPGMQSTGGFSQ